MIRDYVLSRWRIILDILVLQLVTSVIVSFVFKGVPLLQLWEGSPLMHVSSINMISSNLPNVLRWNPYWHFGTPFLRFYPPLSYYLWALVTWVLNTSVFEAFTIYSCLIFSLSSVFIYFLGYELGLKRVGCFTCSLLFVTSFNLYAFWDVGSIPNITALAFSIATLLFFLRAVRTKKLSDTLACAIFASTVSLTHLNNALIMAILLIYIGVILVIFRPALLFKRRGPNEPPIYTLRLPKLLLTIALIALAIGFFWWLPFLTSGGPDHLSSYVTVGLTSVVGISSLISTLFQIIGFTIDATNLFSPGLGHFLLAIIGTIIVFKSRQEKNIIVLASFALCVIACFLPGLGISLGITNRFAPYLSLFAAVLGAYTIEKIYTKYEQLVHSKHVFNTIIVLLLVLVIVYPTVAQVGTIFTRTEFAGNTPDTLVQLKDRMNIGERVATDLSYTQWQLNAYTDQIWQSGSSDLASMTNDFTYTFLYYTFIKKDSAYLPYFSRNYNVRWVMSDMNGLVQTDYGVPEVEGFDSSFVEAVGLNETLLLFIGDSSEYSLLFQSQAMINSKDTILVNGGDNLEGYDLETLKKFDAVYLNGLLNGNSENLETQYNLLSEYVSGGRGVILDTGDIKSEEDLVDIPDLFPVEATATHTESTFLLSENASTTLTKNLNLTKMNDNQQYTISYGVHFKEGSEVLILDEDRSVVAYWELGAGKVLWTGLRLPYSSNYYGLSQDINEEARAVYDERAKLLSEMVNFVAKESSGESTAQIAVEYPEPEKIIVHVENAVPEEGIWVKMSYFPGWTAEIKDEQSSINVFKAGPDMMMVFPNQNGSYTLTFYFGKTWDVIVGEAVSLVSIIAIAVFFVYKLFRHLKNKHHVNSQWDKTEHTGSRNKDINSNFTRRGLQK
ncbi:MAG: 6-pyruvoyl-tetrahydropterin synthase-related protein [archaeon]